jgi:acetaldehyde dehydrogenase/alcohol dehydrogenase
MANAATIAGLAFSNAFVGANHALAHAFGARFGVAHGRANGLFLPHVLRYNAALPRKFMPAPGYGSYVAPQKYAQAAWVLGMGGHGEDEARRRLFARVEEVLDAVGMPGTVADLGIDPAAYEAAIPGLVRDAFRDASLRTNPRMAMIAELADLFGAVR